MNSMWLSLLWKEWREHQWKLLALAAIMLGLIVLTKPDNARNWIDMSAVLIWMAGAGGAAFIALGVAAGENSRGSRSYIQSQPLPMWRLGLVKLVVGAVAAALPGIIAFGLLGLIGRYGSVIWPELEAGFRYEMSLTLSSGISEDVGLMAVSTCVTLSFYLWVAALGANAANEVRAAALGLGGIVLWCLALGAAGAVIIRLSIGSGFVMLVYALLISIGPLGFGIGQSLARELGYGATVLAIISLASHLLIAVVYVYRFSKPYAGATKPVGRGVATQSESPAYLSPPFSSPTGALAWKGLRECLPVVAIGLVGALGATAMLILANLVETGPNRWSVRMVIEFTSAMLIFFGVMVAVVIGIGVLLSDLSPSLNTFWRSRPVRADRMFAAQFAVGGLVLLAAFAVPAQWLVAWMVEDHFTQSEFQLMGAFMLCAYALAVGCTAITRHAVYSAILALGGAISVVVIAAQKLESVAWGNALLLTVALAAMVIAWLAYRNDWALRA